MFDFDDLIGWVIGALIVGFLIFGVVALISADKQYQANMQECLKDHKAYECHAMLDDHSSVYPVVVPMRIGK